MLSAARYEYDMMLCFDDFIFRDGVNGEQGLQP